MYASRDLATGKPVGGEAGLPTASVLDPDVVLSTHPTARAALGSGASTQMTFWMAF
jgi:hypothetical protein